MTTRRSLSMVLKTAVLAFALPVLMMPPLVAQSNDAKKTTQKAGKEARGAAKQAGQAAKDAGKATKQAVAAALPNGAPKDATGQCTDGTYTTAASRRGACSGHGGVKMFATARCTDGTYSFSKSTKGACSAHGGVKAKV
ncbi:MAG: DUF3761 domain-containing protein [Acidobacteriota bacterium]